MIDPVLLYSTLFFCFLASAYLYKIYLKNLVTSWPMMKEKYNWLTGHGPYALKMLSTPTGWIEGAELMAQKYPDSCILWIHSFLPRLFVNDPITVKAIVSHNPELIQNDHKFPCGLGCGQGLLGLNGKTWRTHRKYLSPSMKLKLLQSYIPIMNECARTFVDVLIEKQEKLLSGDGNKFFDMCHNINNYTIDVMLRCLMSYETDIQIKPKELDLIAQTEILAKTAHFRAYVPLPEIFWYLHPLRRKQLRAIKTANDILDKVIDNRIEFNKALNLDDGNTRCNSDDVKNFIDLALENENFTKEEIRNELLTVLLAGQETVFSTLSWFLFNYAKSDYWAEKARDEVEEIMQGQTEVTFEHLKKLDVIERMLKESQRMHPTIVQLNPRVLLTDLEIPKSEKYNLPPRKILKNSDVCINVAGLHKNPKYYRDPHIFNPDRWIDDDIDSFAFIPFAGGARQCTAFDLGDLHAR